MCCYDHLSLDGVFVPELIARILQKQAIESMMGKDGFGLIVNEFNQFSERDF